MILTSDYLWFRLFNTKGLGIKSLHKIYNVLTQQNMSVVDLFKLDSERFHSIFSSHNKGKFSSINYDNITSNDESKIYFYYQKIKEDGFKIISLEHEEYPQNVKEKMQDDSPPILFCKGYIPLLNTLGISIVGSRDVDEFAVLLTKSIAGSLALKGYNVTSGYAKGVDTNAHLGALENEGTTTAILSYGINYLSIRKEFRQLDWERNTLFVTQFAPYEKFSGRNAMARNKLVCSMSKAVVVIASGPEIDSSGKMSGTFDAGKTALLMNIPLFVLSPSLFEKAPQGNIDLINKGGIEIKNGNDIISTFENNISNHSDEQVAYSKNNSSSSQFNLF